MLSQISPTLSLCILSLALSATASRAPSPPQHLFANPSVFSDYQIPTVHESAVLARRILNLSTIATLATVFPDTSSSSDHSDEKLRKDDDSTIRTASNAPPSLYLSGAPIGLMDYYASCPPSPSNPTILAISIATSFRNVAAGSNISLSLRWHPPSSNPKTSASSKTNTNNNDDDDDNMYDPIDSFENDPYLYSPANLPRFSLEGYIEHLPAPTLKTYNIAECFFARHHDARTWAPGNDIHESWWARLVVRGVYWIGGFGDRAYIGWIPVEEWEGVTDEEISGARLVGEEGWREYARERRREREREREQRKDIVGWEL